MNYETGFYILNKQFGGHYYFLEFNNYELNIYSKGGFFTEVGDINVFLSLYEPKRLNMSDLPNDMLEMFKEIDKINNYIFEQQLNLI